MFLCELSVAYVKGEKLCAPQGMSLRPTSDHVKETLFNMIAKEISGAVVFRCFLQAQGILGLSF